MKLPGLSILNTISVTKLFLASQTVQNAALSLVSHFQHLVDEEQCTWNLDTCIRGATERLPSVLMTALVTALGLLPLAIGSGQPGREIEGPMATIIVGGLITPI